MFEFQGTMYFFKATNLIGLDKLGGEVRDRALYRLLTHM